jgi:hypothetical protein
MPLATRSPGAATTRGLEGQKKKRLAIRARTLDNLFRRRIDEGAELSPFVSVAILQTSEATIPLP